MESSLIDVRPKDKDTITVQLSDLIFSEQLNENFYKVHPRPEFFANDSPEVPKLAAAFLAPDCAGARGLTDGEIAKLKAIAAKTKP